MCVPRSGSDARRTRSTRVTSAASHPRLYGIDLAAEVAGLGREPPARVRGAWCWRLGGRCLSHPRVREERRPPLWSRVRGLVLRYRCHHHLTGVTPAGRGAMRGYAFCVPRRSSGSHPRVCEESSAPWVSDARRKAERPLPTLDRASTGNGLPPACQAAPDSRARVLNSAAHAVWWVRVGAQCCL